MSLVGGQFLTCTDGATLSFEGVIFIDGSSRQSIETALGGFALSKCFGNTYTDALSWIGSRNKRWLMLFDNVDDPGVRLHEYFPRSSNHSILITTRHREVIRFAQGKNAQCNISELDPGDAHKLLLDAAGLDADELQDSEKATISVLLQVCECMQPMYQGFF